MEVCVLALKYCFGVLSRFAIISWLPYINCFWFYMVEEFSKFLALDSLLFIKMESFQEIMSFFFYLAKQAVHVVLPEGLLMNIWVK